MKSDYERLLNELNSNFSGKSLKITEETSSESKLSEDSTFLINSEFGQVCTSVPSSNSQRCKPNPPARRSSEIKNSVLSSPVLFNTNNSDDNLVLNSVANVTSAAITLSLQISTCYSTSTSTSTVKSPLSISPQISNLFFSNSKSVSSRSLTPSPPPPPLPIQLHYPYPGMQSHVNHSVSSSRSNSTLFTVSCPNVTRSTPPNPLTYMNTDSMLRTRNTIPSNPVHTQLPPRTSMTFQLCSNSVICNQIARKSSLANVLNNTNNQLILNYNPHQIHQQQQHIHNHRSPHHHHFHHHHLHNHNPHQIQTRSSLLIDQRPICALISSSRSINGSTNVGHYFPNYPAHRLSNAIGGQSSVDGSCNSGILTRSNCIVGSVNSSTSNVNPNNMVVQTLPSG